MADVRVRPLTSDDLADVLAANNVEVPKVSELDDHALRGLVTLSESALGAEVDGQLGGFVLALPPGVAYTSANYRWLSERYDDFVYIDRIVVFPTSQGNGLGRALYDAVIDATEAPVLLAEVNTRPRNDASLAFHERYGFEEVGRAEPYGDGLEVAYLAKDLTAGGAG